MLKKKILDTFYKLVRLIDFVDSYFCLQNYPIQICLLSVLRITLLFEASLVI